MRGLAASAVRYPPAAFGVVFLTIFAGAAALVPYLGMDPYAIHPYFDRMAPFRSWAFPLGTDELGRDVLTRLLWSARHSFLVGALAVGIGVSIGALGGLLAGYVGGVLDAVVSRIADVFLIFPTFLLTLIVVTATGPGVLNVAYGLVLTIAPTTARILRGQVRAQRDLEYAIAARASGVPPHLVMIRHVLPNSISPLLAIAFLALGMSVVAETTLAFIGAGERPPEPSWGVMLYNTRSTFLARWFDVIVPAGSLGLVLFSLNCISDALRDALDPRRRRAGSAA